MGRVIKRLIGILVWLGALEPHEIEQLFGEPIDAEDLYSEAVEAWDSCRQTNLVDRTLQFYTELYLQDGILAKVDRASMMHGLEVRSPFLDLEVADFARRLPHRVEDSWRDYEISSQESAGAASSARHHLPEEEGIWHPGRSMVPFRATPAAAEANSLKEKLASHRSGVADERLYLWCQLCYGEWLAKLGLRM